MTLQKEHAEKVEVKIYLLAGIPFIRIKASHSLFILRVFVNCFAYLPALKKIYICASKSQTKLYT
jgi:hypothetical protein